MLWSKVPYVLCKKYAMVASFYVMDVCLLREIWVDGYGAVAEPQTSCLDGYGAIAEPRHALQIDMLANGATRLYFRRGFKWIS